MARFCCFQKVPIQPFNFKHNLVFFMYLDHHLIINTALNLSEKQQKYE